MKPPPPRALAYLEGELSKLAEAGLLRARPGGRTRLGVSFCSNDYLGLADATGSPSLGAGASRLVAGEHDEHIRLEEALADWLGHQGALLFTSGYAANTGTLPALATSPDDIILSDAFNHASIVDGCRLSRAETQVYPHLDLVALDKLLRGVHGRRAVVVTESYFSMDADSPDLRALRKLCDAYGAVLMVDEAHALGVLGPAGRGLLAEAGVAADVMVGTLGKAFGAGGAFVAGERALVSWLWNRARTFVFSTGLSPALAAAGLDALTQIRLDSSRRGRALERANELRAGLLSLGITPLGFGPIIPWVIGDARVALQIATALREKGFDVQAIRPPSVPPGTARIRFAASASQSANDITRLLEALRPLVS